ncbi:MAG TPA: D-aminoacylase, partial [Sphingomonas sp.]|nr:D-aminoacylase [Sphingomonas sp.]
MDRTGRWMAALATLLLVGCAAPQQPSYDLLIRNGTIYDGSGRAPFTGDVAVRGDRVVYVGGHAPGIARRTIDATGKAVAPGFINMLSWSTESLLVDGRGLSDLRQGVTLEVMGEGSSMGPLTPAMAKTLVAQQEEGIRYPVRWTTLGGYLDHVAGKGIAPNIASFVGAATAREM